MQMEQTVAEARLEQVYQHYKKSRTQLEGELVAFTQKDRLRTELLKQESEDRKDRKERSPSGGVGRFVGWFRGRSARSSNGGSGPGGPGGSRPGSAAGLAAAHALSLSLGGSSSTPGLASSQHGEPATEAERRMAAREISADNLSLPRAASLQLPAPVNCQVIFCRSWLWPCIVIAVVLWCDIAVYHPVPRPTSRHVCRACATEPPRRGCNG